MPDLAVIVPTRGRPESLPRIVDAWTATGAWTDAWLIVVVDADDPELDRYKEIELSARTNRGPVTLAVADEWRPMVPKLNIAATRWITEVFAMGFMGDDHLPRTHGWAKAMIDTLREMGTGVVTATTCSSGSGWVRRGR
jgi:Glycosyltransferases involved in cell wall biogenesis